MKNLLTLGYALATSTDEQGALASAARGLRIDTKLTNKCVYGDTLFQKSLNAVALTGVSLATTLATGTQVVEAFDVNTFVNATASSNYTVDTVGAAIKATLTTTDCIITSNAFTVTSSNYCVLKVGTEAIGTGTISYFVSRDGGVDFRQIYPGNGKILAGTPAGLNFVFKVVLTGNAQITGGIGFSLR
jgi:hypothetical protein